MEATVSRDDDNGFDQLKEKILFLLDLYGKQLEGLQRDTLDTKIQTQLALASIQRDILALRDTQNKNNRTLAHFLGEGLKIASAIITAYVLFKFGIL